MADANFDRLKAALADRYTIERELGAGGMATVYLAADLKHHRKVAVKVLRPDLAAALGPERFLQEIEIAAQLQHPNILALYDSGEADGFLFYVMPYIEGPSLRDKLAKEGELPIGDAVRILRDVVDALTAAHSHGVVHRDIKPENILLSGRHALVTDFGVAKAVSEATGREKLTTAGVALGTPAYMAPEQASADPHLDQRVDIYAVGAVAYELLTGRPVFMGTTPQMILSAHMTEPPQPVTKFRDTVPAALESVVMRCLEKRPADRWQSAEELLPHLEALATPSGGVTPTNTKPVVTMQAVRRKTLIGAVAFFGVLVTIVIGLPLITGRVGTGEDQSGGRIPIAVLVFESRSRGEDAESLSEGIADAINTKLSAAGGLLVKAHASARRMSRDEMQYSEIAERLGVDFLVHGNWRSTYDSIRITVRLIDPETEGQLWAADYTRQFTASNVFSVTGNVALELARALQAELAPEERDRIDEKPTESLEAYKAYIMGRVWMERRGTQGSIALERAIEYFEEALQEDSAYAPAYAGVAGALLLSPMYGEFVPRDVAHERARSALQTALGIDDGLAEAHAAVGLMRASFEWDWEGAEESYRRALALNPDYATAYHWYGYLLISSGRAEEALPVMRQALELDPLSAIINEDLGDAAYYARQYREAIEQYERTLSLFSDRQSTHAMLGLAYLELGIYDEAKMELILAEGQPGELPHPYAAAITRAYTALGHQDSAAAIIDRTRDWTLQARVWAYAGMRDIDRTLAVLDSALEQRAPWLGNAIAGPFVDFLHPESRFVELRRRMGSGH